MKKLEDFECEKVEIKSIMGGGDCLTIITHPGGNGDTSPNDGKEDCDDDM